MPVRGRYGQLQTTAEPEANESDHLPNCGQTGPEQLGHVGLVTAGRANGITDERRR